MHEHVWAIKCESIFPIIKNKKTERSSCPQAWKGQKCKKYVVHATF